jgi:hypothetical protein
MEKEDAKRSKANRARNVSKKSELTLTPIYWAAGSRVGIDPRRSISPPFDYSRALAGRGDEKSQAASRK